MTADRVAPVRKSSGDCPKCKATLKVVFHEEIAVDACPSCWGVWVVHADEKTVLKVRPEVFSVAELRRLRKLYKPYAREDSVRYVPCPACRNLMHRVNWASQSGVVVDRCEDHGTWYDEGELEKLKEFVTLGGIEYEKLRMTERGLSDLTSRLGREISRLDRRVDSAYLRARLFSMLGF